MRKKVGILRFPGTNCDADVFDAYKYLGAEVEYLWHRDRFDSKKWTALVLPGGFSYGDYLRAGALSAKAPAMLDVGEAAKAGVPVLGICNGFQILCEAGLLEGVLTKNISLQFQEEWVDVVVTGSTGPWIKKTPVATALKLPIAHSMGRYFADEQTLDRLFESEQVWLTYQKNPNGALRDIAGLKNKSGNVAALMPHPERAIAKALGSEDGRKILESVL